MKEELTGMLVEYSACKEVAAQLRSMAEGVYTVVREPAEVELDTEYRLRHDVYLLEEAYNALQGRSRQKQPPRQEQFEPLTTAPFVSVTSRIIHVLRGLMTGRVRRLRPAVRQGGGAQPDRGYVPRGSGTGARRTHRHRGRRIAHRTHRA